MSRDSSYYPRRAGVWSAVVTRMDVVGRAGARLVSLIPEDVELTGLIAAVLVPGLAYYLRHRDRSGKAAMAVCALLLLVFVACLGYAVANLAFTLLLCIHVLGVVAYCQPMFMRSGLTARLLSSLMLCTLTIGLVYVPLRNFLSERFIMPLRVHDKVVVIHCQRRPAHLRRGQWIAFNVVGMRNYFNEGGAHGNVVIEDGINLAPVLAVSGDRITFDSASYYVNGVAHDRLANMPSVGEWDVPDGCCFAWPDLRMSGHGAIPAGDISQPMLQIAEVTPDRFIGTVFQHWFGRRQSFS